MFNSSFEVQVTEFLANPVVPCDRDIVIMDTCCMVVSRWKDLWFKAPEPEDFSHTKEGYLKAFALGYLDNFWLLGIEMICPHIEGGPLKKEHIPLLWELWSKMEKDRFYLIDWTLDNVIIVKGELKVIDWGYWDTKPELGYKSLCSFIAELT